MAFWFVYSIFKILVPTQQTPPHFRYKDLSVRKWSPLMPGTITTFTQVVKEKRQTGSACLIVLSILFSWALDGGERSASRPGQSNPGRKTACSHWVGDREMGPAILLYTSENTKIACPYRESNHDSLVILPVLYSVYRFLPAALKQVVYIVTIVICDSLFYWRCNQIWTWLLQVVGVC
jgi:hypothetical protein